MANDQALDTLQIDIQASGVSAADGIQKLADAIRHLRTTVGKDGSKLDNLSKALTAVNTAVGRTNYGKIMSVAASLSRLANSLNMVHGASAQSFQNVIRRIEKLEGTVTKPAESVEKMKESLNGGWSGVGQSNPITETLDGITESAKEAQEEVAKVADQIKGGTFNMPGLGGALGKARVDASSRRSLNAQREKEERADIQSQEQAYQQIANTAIRVFATVKKAAGESIRATIRLVENIGRAFMKVGKIAGSVFLTPLKAVGNRLRTLYRQVTGFVRAIGRIALYRAIRSAIKAVTQGLQEGIQNLYQWSLLMDHTFANSMDSIATSMQYLHNGFAAMFSPLIEYAAPILEEITNKVVDFFNIIQQIFATLTGQTTWHKAIRVQKQYGDQIAETGQAAEKAMHQLMAFDELNVINSPSAGGSGGSGQQTPDYGSMFTTEEVDTELTSWVQDIMDFFESGQWTRLGSYIGEKLNNIVNQWNAFADGFNFGLKIRHALQALNSFLETFNFYDIGSKVGDWLAGFVNGVDPAEVQKAIVLVLNSAVSGASGLIDALNRHNIPAKIGQALGAAFANFNWEGLANLARKILTGVVNLVNSASQSFIENGGPQKLIDAAKEIGSAIGEAFATADWGSITTIITSIFTGLVSMFSTAISSFVEMGGPAKLKESLATIGKAIGEAFANIRGKDLAEIINSISTGIFEMFKSGINAFSKGQGWKELGELIQGLDWAPLFKILVPVLSVKILSSTFTGIIAPKIISGFVKAINLIPGLGLAAKALGVGAALTLGVWMTLEILGLDNIDLGQEIDQKITDICDDIRERFRLGMETPEGVDNPIVAGIKNWLGSIVHTVFPAPFDALMEMLYPDLFTPSTEPKPTDGKPGAQEQQTTTTQQGTSFPGGGKNDTVRNALTDVLGLEPGQFAKTLLGIEGDVHDLYNDRKSRPSTGGSEMLPGIGNLTSGSLNIPFKLDLKKVLGDELNQAGGILDASAFPAKVGALGTKAADMLKNGVKNANIPKVFDDEATVSATKFGTHDFSPGGLHAGEDIKVGVDRADLSGKMASVREGMLSKLREGDYEGNGKNIMDRTGNGMDSVNLPQKIANTAASMLNSLRWAGWEGVGAQIGDAAGANFKPHFKQHLQTSITLYGSGGTPLTTVYAVPYAQGGFPSQGSLFLAGEMAGQAEMIGTINGRTGVASGREITGISDAVYATGNEEASLLRQTNILLQALLAKDPFGTPNSNAGRWITQSQQAYKAVKG